MKDFHAAASVREVRATEKRWNDVFLRIYLPYIGLGFVLAMTLPDSGVGFLKPLVDAVAGFIPSIDRLARLSTSPEMTRSFGALMWLIQPIVTILALWRSPRAPLRVLPWHFFLIVMPAGLIVFVLLGILFPFYFVDEVSENLGYLKGRGVAGLTFIVSGRTGHGTLGSVMFAFSSYSQVMLWRIIRDIPGMLVFNIRARRYQRSKKS